MRVLAILSQNFEEKEKEFEWKKRIENCVAVPGWIGHGRLVPIPVKV